ncbi:hypothetical protein G7Y89_g7644 [Cudoniella acicularis]|uniref:AAA+ ATPase domain-containing protein n=1 Tax=Cudoniella acicularis TaxID=354080 RepID=A0A8H4RK34_9HELO|nr:hypothetical protein G7Y89_g7644 [Cudoniella acicularis]
MKIKGTRVRIAPRDRQQGTPSLSPRGVDLECTDEIHEHLIQFLAHQYKLSSSRRLMAETPSTSAWQLDSEDTEAMETTVDADGNIKWLNFSNQKAKSRPRFTPALGAHNFWYDKTYFQLRRRQDSVFDALGGGRMNFNSKESLTLSCFGRSTQPIKKLIQNAKGHYHSGYKAKTMVKRPASKEMRRYGGRGVWLRVAERPCRPMKTVVLDEERKMDVLFDINEYLNPATARWYANRGIPYRRGYLFYGPPGTGKTSLTFALAGVFGLDIHVVSLLEPTLTEEELGMLFTNLPARCIVLLEDIDTAGLIRNDPVKSEELKSNGKASDIKNDFNVVDLTKALKKANQQSEEDRQKGISLSGLLNIIDGVASHEGRVLVMTTNHPEKLDEALIRPGRVDHQVGFTNATQTQTKELFERMYMNDRSRTKLVVSNPEKVPAVNGSVLTPPPTPISMQSNGAAGGSAKSEKLANGHAIITRGENHLDELKEGELDEIASQFAEKVPNDLFSPAEIQGFLLKRKKDPKKALAEVDAWVDAMVEQKENGRRLMKVQ